MTAGSTPDGWARRVAQAYDRWRANSVIVEINQGGELVTKVLEAAHANLPIPAVNASRGKVTRADPIALLYEQGRVHHVGSFPLLEDECCTWLPHTAESPDRLDALVWGLTELMLSGGIASAPVFLRRESR